MKFIIFLLFTILISAFPNSVDAQTLGSSCENFLIDGLTPALHGPLNTGQSYNISITMSNEGDITWSPTISPTNPGEFKLGAQLPQDSPNWGTASGGDSGLGSRPIRAALTGDVPPGGNITFSFTATAPSVPDTYLLAYQMVWEGIQWFGAICQPSLQVGSAAPPPPPPPASGGSCPAGVDPGQACGECVAERCSNGDQCATGHTYCVFDPDGNFCGPCQREVDNCAVQCSTVTPSPTSGGSIFEVGPAPAGLAQIQQTFINVVGIAVALGFVALFVFLAWAGFKYLVSGGEAKAVHAAHQTVTWALLGVLFLAIAWLILRLIEAFTGIKVTIFDIWVLFQ